MNTETTAAAPIDLLLALPDSKENTEILMGVADAMLSGAEWRQRVPAGWWYFWDGDLHFGTLTSDGRFLAGEHTLPNPLGTGEAADAAAYRMEERERLDVLAPAHESMPGNPWLLRFYTGEDGAPWQRRHDRKAAAAAAVCAKHAEDPEVGPLCKDVLRRLEGYTR